MRAGGLLAGSLLLVAGWLAWFATSGPSRGPLVVRGSASHHREAPHLQPPEALPEPEPADLDPLHPTPVLAETLGGDSLADVARELGLPGRLLAVSYTHLTLPTNREV